MMFRNKITLIRANNESIYPNSNLYLTVYKFI